MSINRICRCKRTFSLSTLTCPHCRTPLILFKVRLRRQGRWLTRVCDSVDSAIEAEAEFRGAATCSSPSQTPSPAEETLAPTLGQIWPRYLAYVSDRNRSWRDDAGRYQLHIEPRLEGRRLAEVSPQDVLDCLPSDRAPATRHRVLALLKRLFNWSIKMGLFPGPNPCRQVDPPRYDNSRQRYLSGSERDALLDSLGADQNDFAVRAIRFLALTGRRRGEVLSMEWSDVDMERGMVRFRRTKNGKVQVVPVNEGALAILKGCPRMSPLVFPCSSGGFYHSFNRSWVRIRDRAGLVDFHLHDLRHAFASVLASSGRVDIYTLQRLLGHSQITMTQRYAHLIPGALREAAEVGMVW